MLNMSSRGWTTYSNMYQVKKKKRVEEPAYWREQERGK